MTRNGILFLLLIFGTLVRNSSGQIWTSKEDDSDNEIDNCIRLSLVSRNAPIPGKINLFELLNEGNNLITPEVDRDNTEDDAILILGNTGSGKTTLTQIIAGDLTRIHSVLTQSGKLVIVDEDDRIGVPSTVSKTIVPEKVILNTGNESVLFYDCPGFDDTRGSEMDIAANFFMNQILKRVKRVKMLFLVTYSSVKLGNDRLDFDLMVSHASKLIKNMEKFDNSFGLVVTKVSSYSAFGRYIKDKQIMRGIVEFLAIYNETMHSKLIGLEYNSTEREMVEKKLYFVETLLQRDENGNYPKITFSRSPEKCGPLSDSTVVSNTKQLVTSLYRDHLEFQDVDPDDFGFTLKVKTILDIANYTSSLSETIFEKLTSTFEAFEKWYEIKHFSSIPDSQTVLKELQTASAEVRALLEKMQRSPKNFTELSEFIITFLEGDAYPVKDEFKTFLRQQQSHFLFFNEAVGGETQDFNLWMMQPVQNLQKNLTNLRDWYEFVSSVEKQVEDYPFHQNKRKDYKILEDPNIQSWVSYLETHLNFPVGSHIISITSKLRPLHFASLDRMLRFALPHPVFSCIEGTLKVFGNYTKLSDFINDKGVFDKPVVDFSCGIQEIKQVEVYAAQTLFIDRDIDAVGKELKVVLLAPKWFIVQNTHLKLDGYNGQSFIQPTAENGGNGVRGLNGGRGRKGADGLEGNPGWPGGYLFGILESFEGIGRLTVTSNGGSGGPGQNGGNGGEGADGIDARPNEVGWSSSTNLITITYYGSHSGHSGAPGGDGGSGGVGGQGGYPGSISIISPNNETRPITIGRERGQQGEGGKGGEGGFGGRDGTGIQCENKKILFLIPYRDQCRQNIRNHHRGPVGAAGLSDGWKWGGADNNWYPYFSPAQKTPRRPMSIPSYEKIMIVQKFKTEYGGVYKSDTKNFIRYLNTL